MTDAALDAEALVERRGGAGVIVLNRPKALNALTLTMVRTMAAALDDWERDPAVTRIVVRGAGEKAFCAGGDIRHLYDLGRAGDHASQLTFWREEYLLNARIRVYPKPVVALIDGIVMGGGVGVSINAAHRVAGDRFVFAMPEVGIGFFPDVGANLLPAAPRAPRWRLFRAHRPSRQRRRRARLRSRPDLRAKRRDRRPCRGAGEAMPRSRRRSPASPRSPAVRPDEGGGRARGLFLAHEPRGDPRVARRRRAQRLRLRGAGARRDAGEIADQPGDRAEANGARNRRSTSARPCEVEYRIVSRICRGHDFYEGVRALIVDKDNRPRWSAPPSQAELDGYFAPIGDDELTFPAPR